MKKMLFAILAVLAAATFTACGKKAETEEEMKARLTEEVKKEMKEKAMKEEIAEELEKQEKREQKKEMTQYDLFLETLAIYELAVYDWKNKLEAKHDGKILIPIKDKEKDKYETMNNTPDERERNTKIVFGEKDFFSKKTDLEIFKQNFGREINYKDKKAWYKDIMLIPEAKTRERLTKKELSTSKIEEAVMTYKYKNKMDIPYSKEN